MIRRVLIANRGEIACRIIRTCRAIGVETVAVYSEADAGAPHVQLANEAVPIGPAPALESYLSIPRLIEAARRTSAEAVHPGYGFLSENADFAEACAMAGLTFVGPSAGVMRRMGSKTGARDVAAKAGVPVVPGATPRLQTPDALAAAVKDVGYPALVKAAAGGGGKGMRVVRTGAEVADAVGAARREAERSFGNGALYVERLIERPRHIEVQILADSEGDVVHVFERDCSLQRRHQKVIEETPAPQLSPAVRERITAAAVAVAKAVRYLNAGTVEFLLEGEGDAAQFYFLEMNTRLQVEHPITEAVTGLDLVTLQLEIAARAPMPIRQSDIRPSGHAVECRVYAEDSQRLLPQAGQILHYREPQGPGVRVDSGVTNGSSVPVHYDPLLAKAITHGATRDEALSRMKRAIRDFEILGVHHNLAFLTALLNDPLVEAGRTYTQLIEERLPALTAAPPPAVAHAAAAAAAYLSAGQAAPEASVPESPVQDRPAPIAPAQIEYAPAPVELAPAFEPVGPAPVFEPIELAPAFEPVERAPASVPPIELAPAFEPVELAPAFEPVGPAPVFEPIELAPAFEPIERAPEPVPEAEAAVPVEPAPAPAPAPTPATAREKPAPVLDPWASIGADNWRPRR
jgi:acetyl-CoA/propionyl-CoA carboxylase biotin carboxyl carrier protein